MGIFVILANWSFIVIITGHFAQVFVIDKAHCDVLYSVDKRLRKGSLFVCMFNLRQKQMIQLATLHDPFDSVHHTSVQMDGYIEY